MEGTRVPVKRWRYRKRLCVLVICGLGVVWVVGHVALRLVPLPPELWEAPAAQLQITDRHGSPLRTMRSATGQYAVPVDLTEVPHALMQATLAAEDKRFWRHPGVDWRANARSVWQFVKNRRVVSGASTITQQLVKLAHPRPRTFRSKLIEALVALRLEQVWSKQLILSAYLNRLDYGNLNTGCAAAAACYFGKPLESLSPAECAVLAGLPQAPSRLSPVHYPQRAVKRQRWILKRMHEDELLTTAEYQRALEEPVKFQDLRHAFLAPHFVDLVLRHADEAAQAEQRRRAGGLIRTTLDLELNRVVEQSIQRQIRQLRQDHLTDAACVVIDNNSGGVLALVGSADYFEASSGQVNGAWAPRSAGSTFKPFSYLLAFEKGATPASIVADVPTEFATPTGLFAPVNYDRRYGGPVSYRCALANSLNISAVRVLASVGGGAVLHEKLEQCGLTTLSHPAAHYGLGLTIGNAEARLLELANAYACLARLGVYRPYTLVLPEGKSRAGTREQSEAARATRVFDAAQAYLLADVLSDNDARIAAFGSDSNLRFDFRVACKTGTSSDYRDNWAFAYTPEFTVGVWVGRFDGVPMPGISGVTGAAPIMNEVVRHLHDHLGTTWYPVPPEVIEASVHRVTGKRLPLDIPEDPFCVRERFVRGQVPPPESPADYDEVGRVILPADYIEWITSSDNWLGNKAVVAKHTHLEIIFPLPGTQFYLDPDLPDQGGLVRPKCRGAENPVWHCDTLLCQTTNEGITVVLREGVHRLELVDSATGLKRETWIDVRSR